MLSYGEPSGTTVKPKHHARLIPLPQMWICAMLDEQDRAAMKASVSSLPEIDMSGEDLSVSDEDNGVTVEQTIEDGQLVLCVLARWLAALIGNPTGAVSSSLLAGLTDSITLVPSCETLQSLYLGNSMLPQVSRIDYLDWNTGSTW